MMIITMCGCGEVMGHLRSVNDSVVIDLGPAFRAPDRKYMFKVCAVGGHATLKDNLWGKPFLLSHSVYTLSLSLSLS